MSGYPDPNASSITVAVRVRPFTIREAAQLVRRDEGTVFLGDGSLAAAPTPKLNQRGIRPVIKVVDDRCLVFDPPEDNPIQKFSRSVVPAMGKKVKDQVFAFDRVFDENTSQVEVYEGTTKGLLDSVLDGYNATVFAYGATGCGKTHTITGTPQSPGIIFLTMQELFEKINERSGEKHTEVTLSYLEIYNETIRDLLVPPGSATNKQGLMLREDSNQGVSVSGLTSHKPKDVQEVMDMIVQGNEYRTVSPTAANAVSSRSHAVLQINVAQKDRNAAVNEPHTMATLSIIDLAGSERASATKNRGERLMEGANINKSLLALGSCINALCDPRKHNHVPYRNSKLTRLLKFSLGGNCKTVMIVCVSPSSEHFDETQNTLRYANRAKNIQTKVTRNVFNVNRHVKDFLVKIDEQMALINELKAQQRDAEKVFFAKFLKQSEKRDAVVREGLARLHAAYEHAEKDRMEVIGFMKKQRAIERRIGLLSSWIAAFDSVCDARGCASEEEMPAPLTAIRKTAIGIMNELETSRNHIHQRLGRCNWERSLDTALQHSISQLPAMGGNSEGCNAERDILVREAELLRTGFMRDAYHEVVEQDKAGDAAVLQTLLMAQFEIMASVEELLRMEERQAVEHAKGMVNRLLETGLQAAGQVVKPDGSLSTAGYRGTGLSVPKLRRKSGAINGAKTIPQPVFTLSAAVGTATSTSTETAMDISTEPEADVEPQMETWDGASIPHLSPVKARKVAYASSKKAGTSFTFTPVKKKPSVRWRDDETEEGTLADFEKTPQKWDSSPGEPENGISPVRPSMPSYLSDMKSPPPPQRDNTDEDVEMDDGTGPALPSIPDLSGLSIGKPNRFQAGFLSKSRTSLAGSTPGSTLTGNGVLQSQPPPVFNLNLANNNNVASQPNGGDEERPAQPLRSIPVSRAANAYSSPVSYSAKAPNAAPSTSNTMNNGNQDGSPKIPPPPTMPSLQQVDENQPPVAMRKSSSRLSLGSAIPRRLSTSPRSASGGSTDSDNSLVIDPLKLRSALQEKKRRDRLSLMSGTAASIAKAKRRASSAAPLSNGAGSGNGSASTPGPAASRPSVAKVSHRASVGHGRSSIGGHRASFGGSLHGRASMGAHHRASIGAGGHPGLGGAGRRSSMGVGGGPLASATNGISRHRRGSSLEKSGAAATTRKGGIPLPTITGSPPVRSGTTGLAARRVSLGPNSSWLVETGIMGPKSGSGLTNAQPRRMGINGNGSGFGKEVQMEGKTIILRRGR
ncbi:tubulin-dependent ATPase kip3 [Neurospora sp. IMI 360204]|nr:tubulin-dependent ATPase kip3 [Neurospora sp. IMI 360204]